MSAAALDIAAAVAAEREWMEQLLARLVAAETTLGNEEAGQALVAAAFADCGLEPLSVPLDAARLRADPHSSPFSWSVEGKRNVVATWDGRAGAEASGGGGGRGRSLILCGHIDVVPPASAALWTSPPFEPRVEGDWLYGRGGGDMKAGIVAMTGAIRALRRAGVELAGSVQLQSVVEEECTGNGALQCLLDGHTADACVLTEPHPDHLTVAQVGVLWFHVDVRGVPAHAARASTLGFNAIDATYTLLRALRELEAEANVAPPPPYDAFEHPINLNPGIVSGGDWASTVAAECTLSCRLGLYPGESPADARRRVEDTIARAAAADPLLRDHPPLVRYDGFACEGSVVDAGEPLVQELSAAYASVHGSAPRLEATTATTDARHYVRHGIPAVCFGPRAERIHGIDERVSLSSVAEVARVLAAFVPMWCGTVHTQER
ncbi:ArgE/DapE family deacylase [Conexibacter sp. JD483]|uniref:ArgE/DapE family deacylase n=1 Tax=unclassified Conexibacter TaxID=2627773 RepID=UPI0027184AA3|nr:MULTISPECIES: ArgE/DapE family deacylase [unclassified Conexibacter]MDO8187452.1 ArgE/DapE family deacylase [Conexibacter sp. CPCC 205706]MDO8198686.1 ArgE/DapE family deacylase [Conexibacter sp. CPCC 205762]MDR9369864.1 ArgE/DapE family deacylase [Conexibacter sp. JD483]